MRRSLLAAFLLAFPSMVHAENQCAIGAAATASAVQIPKPVNATGAPVDLTPHAETAQSDARPAAMPIGQQAGALVANAATKLDSIPPLQHVVSAGAQLTDLGTSHGMRMVIARNGDQFMLFSVTPDQDGLVSGMIMDMSVDQLLALGGKNASELKPTHGLRAFYLRNGAHFQVFYATPDGQRVIPGVLWDAKGLNLTRDQIGSIPGAVPTIIVGKGIEHTSASDSGSNDSPLRLASATTYGSAGNPHAPQLWMFIDPQCSFSIRAMQELRSYVADGRIRLNIIPLTLLDQEDSGLSTRSALRLVRAPADRMIAAWASGETPAGSISDGALRLKGNMAVADEIGLRGTPTFLWRKADGTEGRADGIPNDIAAMIASIGS